MEFFNGLGKKFSSAARTVQERTRDGVESTRLTMDIHNAKGELDQHMLALGRAYYDSITQPDCAVPEELIQNVRACLAQIESLTYQRDRARQQSRCPGCCAVQSDEAHFCSNCGHAMPEKAPAIAEKTEEEPEYCDHCGAMRESESRFCAVCGTAYRPEDNPPALPDAPESAPIADTLEEPEDTLAE